MFGNKERIDDLQQQIDELRNYCIKFTSDVNRWSETLGSAAVAVEQRIQKLEEKQK